MSMRPAVVVVPILFTVAACVTDDILSAPTARVGVPVPEQSPPPIAPAVVDPIARPRAPGPITGGTLLTLLHGDAHRVAAADPDGDRVFVVDLGSRRVVRTVQLEVGDAPRRMTELLDGFIAVTLARDAIAVFHPDYDGVQRIPTCDLPRGVAYDAARERILVACREGKLVEIQEGDDHASRTVPLPRDLRDVVVAGDRVYVTRFKTAQVILLDAELRVEHQLSLEASPRHRLRRQDTPAVAYRAVAGPDRSLYVLHQLATTDLSSDSTLTVGGDPTGDVPGGDSPYGAPPEGPQDCGRAVVAATITQVTADGRVVALPPIARGTLMVDLASRDDGVAVADAGSRFRSSGAPVRRFAQQLLRDGGDDCDGLMTGDAISAHDPFSINRTGPVTSVVFDREGTPVALMSAPLMVLWGERRIALDVRAPQDNGLRLFHQDAGGSIACASCHPEGEDDGLVWQLPRPRRTPALGGGLEGSAPFHWSGDLATLDALFTEVFSKRMGGKVLSPLEAESLAAWIETIPTIAVPPAVDPDAVSRGAVTYARACASCHAAPLAASLDVGTGEPMQTPPLRGLMFRAPYLHDGCATTLADRFGRCSTPAHGAAVPSAEVDDLIRFLETL